MPTYEYRCEKGHTFERVQKMSDKALTKCPVCGARASRVISGGQGMIFKGSGFYITDYGKDGKGPRKDADSAATGEVKAEAKPDTAKVAKAEGQAAKESKADAKPAKAPGAGKPDPS